MKVLSGPTCGEGVAGAQRCHQDCFYSKESLGRGSHRIGLKGRLSPPFREWQAWVDVLLLSLAGSQPSKPLFLSAT